MQYVCHIMHTNQAHHLPCVVIDNVQMRLLVSAQHLKICSTDAVKRDDTACNIIVRKSKVETKKSERANLERRRPVLFLLGMVVALAAMYVALEYKSAPGDMTADSSQWDDMQDLDLLPAIDHSDMIAAAPSGAPSGPSPEKVKVVDALKKEIENNALLNDMRSAQGDGDGASGGSDSNARDEQETKALSPVAVDNDDNPLKLRVVQQLPEFPGGMVELMKWINKNLRYPYSAQQQKIQGRVLVTFIINRDGTIADIKVPKPVHPLLDNEARRLVKLMPVWKPGMENGKPCRTMFAIPIEFRL